jgi:hypothetical protein
MRNILRKVAKQRKSQGGSLARLGMLIDFGVLSCTSPQQQDIAHNKFKKYTK